MPEENEGWIGSELHAIRMELVATNRELDQVISEQSALNAKITKQSEEIILLSAYLKLVGQNVAQILTYVTPPPPPQPVGFKVVVTSNEP
jgi:hypothetical protein